MASTQKRRKYLGSPLFSDTNTQLVSGAKNIFSYDSDGKASQKYAPLNSIRVTNNDSSSDVLVRINQNSEKEFLVPASTIVSFDQSSFPAIRNVEIENEGSTTINAGLVRVEVQKEVINPQGVVQTLAERWITRGS